VNLNRSSSLHLLLAIKPARPTNFTKINDTVLGCEDRF
jgi:hypothetical protein